MFLLREGIITNNNNCQGIDNIRPGDLEMQRALICVVCYSVTVLCLNDATMAGVLLDNDTKHNHKAIGIITHRRGQSQNTARCPMTVHFLSYFSAWV